MMRSSLQPLLWIFAIFSIGSILVQQGIIVRFQAPVDEDEVTDVPIHHQKGGSEAAPRMTADANRKPRTVSGNYLIEQAEKLDAEAESMERTRSRDMSSSFSVQERNEALPGGLLLRIPFRLHFFTYASDVMNLTKTRILRQAERSGFFVSCHALGPDDLPQEFRREFRDILEDPVGGGYYLWRYPIMERILETIGRYDYFLFIDSGCTVLATGKTELLQWLHHLEHASIDEDFREIMRFPQESDDFAREIKWTTDQVFAAFNLTVEASPEEQHKVWSYKRTGQFNGGLWLGRNGPQLRRMLAYIYRVLAPDPYIITNKYNEPTRTRRPGRFKDHRHDQSISSIACKILQNYILAPIMPEWKKPPFAVTRFRSITEAQLQNWTRACYEHTQTEAVKRSQDEYCDQLALEAFESNTVI